jgi:hypothetical protein
LLRWFAILLLSVLVKAGKMEDGADSTGDAEAWKPMTYKMPYVSYLLRLWQETGEGSPVWRASLESPQSGECHGFADLAGVIQFLEAEMNLVPNESEKNERE